MGDDGRVVGDPADVLTRSGGSTYVSVPVDVPLTEVGSHTADQHTAPAAWAPEPSPPRPRSRFVGWAALAVAVVAGVLTGIGVGVAAGGDFVGGAGIAWAAILVSSVAVIAGILAVIAGFGRLAGAIAIPLGLLANPFVLTQLLGALQQLSAASAATS